MRCEKKFDRGVDRLVIGRKDNENGGIRVNGGKREREREREKERGLSRGWRFDGKWRQTRIERDRVLPRTRGCGVR